MTTAPLLSVQIEMSDVRSNEEIFPNKLFLTYSENVPKGVVVSFQEQSFKLGRFLSLMGSQKIRFQANLENFQPAAVAKICEVMSQLAEAKNMKERAAGMLSKEDPTSLTIDTLQKSADKAAKEYERAHQEYSNELVRRKIEIKF